MQPWLQAVPQVLRVVLGTSDSAPLQSRRLAPGDVLSIAEQTRQLFLADRCIGHFTFIEEGIHMQLTPPDSASLNSADVLPQLPVKLEFVLSELTLSVAQLNEVIERQVLPLEPATANHIADVVQTTTPTTATPPAHVLRAPVLPRDLARLNPEPPDLHLLVDASQILEVAIGQPTASVAGSVET